MLEFARIVNPAAALRRPGRLQICGKLADVLFELAERPEGVDLERRHEAAVIVAAGRLDAKAEAGQQAAQDLDHHRKAIALVALAAADREQRPALPQLARVVGWLAVAANDPAVGYRLVARDRERDLAGGGGRG